MIANTPEAWSERARAPTSHEAAMWSEAGQAQRFKAVLKALDPQPGEWLLDYGCGTGALCELLPDGVGYVGYDWSDGMIKRAKREHADLYRLFTTDVQLLSTDLTACIGTFNLVDNWSRERTWETLRGLWQITKRALAVSLYAGDDLNCIDYRGEIDELWLGAETETTVTQPRANDILILLER